MVACCEGMSLGDKLGIDPKILMNILAVSTSACWCITTANPIPGNLPNTPNTKNYVELLRKDMGFALEIAE